MLSGIWPLATLASTTGDIQRYMDEEQADFVDRLQICLLMTVNGVIKEVTFPYRNFYESRIITLPAGPGDIGIAQIKSTRCAFYRKMEAKQAL